MINRCILVGRLVADPELRETANGKPVGNFRIAVERSRGGQNGEKTADFFPVVVWGKLAELCASYVSKGSMVGIVGSIQNRSYEDSQGNKRNSTEIIADEVQFIGKKTATATAEDSERKRSLEERIKALDESPLDALTW